MNLFMAIMGIIALTKVIAFIFFLNKNTAFKHSKNINITNTNAAVSSV